MNNMTPARWHRLIRTAGIILILCNLFIYFKNKDALRIFNYKACYYAMGYKNAIEEKIIVGYTLIHRKYVAKEADVNACEAIGIDLLK